MVYLTDNQIKNELGINNWRNLLNNKIIRFTSMMPQMNPVVMVELVGQLPQFWHFAKTTLRSIELKPVIQQHIQLAGRLLDVRRFLDRDLDTDHNNPDDKKRYLDTILEAIGYVYGNDALGDEERKYIMSVHDYQGCNTRTMLIAILSFLGGQSFK